MRGSAQSGPRAVKESDNRETAHLRTVVHPLRARNRTTEQTHGPLIGFEISENVLRAPRAGPPRTRNSQITSGRTGIRLRPDVTFEGFSSPIRLDQKTHREFMCFSRQTELNAKSVRRAIANIREAGPDNVSCILQGRLDANNALLDAGITVQPKTKPQPAVAAK